MLSHEVESGVYVLGEAVEASYLLVGRRYDDVGVRIASYDTVSGPCHARSGVAVNGFGKDVLAWHIGQLLLHQ